MIKTTPTRKQKTKREVKHAKNGRDIHNHGLVPVFEKWQRDAGQFDDGKEVERGTDPLNEADDTKDLIKTEVGVPVVLDGILFASGKANISPQSYSILEKAYQTLIAYPEMEVEIQGHTDNTGSLSLNMRLSQERAESVRAYLTSKGIEGFRITAKGGMFGSHTPSNRSTNTLKTKRSEHDDRKNIDRFKRCAICSRHPVKLSGREGYDFLQFFHGKLPLTLYRGPIHRRTQWRL